MTFKIVSSCNLNDVPEAVGVFQKVGTLVQAVRDRNQLLGELSDCDAYLAGAELRVDRQFLDHAPKLKLIGSPATGKDHLDLELINARGITLFHLAQEYDLLRSFTATSEFSFALLLAIIRRLPAAIEDARRGVWARETYTGMQLFGKTLGILGLGRLGSISARIGQGFGMRVIAHDKEKKYMDGVENVDFDTLFRESDVVTIHVHLNRETEGLISRKVFGEMKKGAILINTSRGRIVDEQALLEALQSGQLAGAGLDVIDGEWLSQEELLRHPLIQYAQSNDNLLITPHVASATRESIKGARLFMARKMATHLEKTAQALSV